MSTPPIFPQGSSNSQPSPQSASDPTGNQSDFRKPDKKEKQDKQQNQNGNGGAAGNPALGSLAPLSMGGAAQAAAAAKIAPSANVQSITALNQVIVRAVSSMQVNTDGSLIQMTLKQGSNLPTAFQGGSMTIEMKNGQMLIRFDNVQVDSATNLLQSNPEATKALANQLALFGINQVDMQIGGQKILTLPKADIAPMTPIEVHSGTQQQYYQRDGGGQGGQQQQQQQHNREPE